MQGDMRIVGRIIFILLCIAWLIWGNGLIRLQSSAETDILFETDSGTTSATFTRSLGTIDARKEVSTDRAFCGVLLSHRIFGSSGFPGESPTEFRSVALKWWTILLLASPILALYFWRTRARKNAPRRLPTVSAAIVRLSILSVLIIAAVLALAS